jgi:hypothetical protein
LPLDNHLDRLNPTNYSNFYNGNFLKNQTSVTLPADWIRPGGHLTNAWITAPNAAFPSYSFSVERGAGINLAFPVEGVPVGLSLLGSDAADGTVIIKNAHTLGIDTVSLYYQLQNWAGVNASFLSNFGSHQGTNYLRVVTRIYTVGYVDISLRDASSQSAGLDVGAAKPVNLLAPQLMQGTNADSGTVRSNFVEGNSVLQNIMTNALGAKDAAGNLLPGGSLRLTAASARTISMRETFDPPLTIGYLGFDCAILQGGFLGPPISTFAVLSTNFNLRPLALKSSTQRLLDYTLYKAISEQTNDPQAKILTDHLDALVAFVPPGFARYEADNLSPTNFILAYEQVDPEVLHNPKLPGFRLFLSYKDGIDKSVTLLQSALHCETFTLLNRDTQTKKSINRNDPDWLLLKQQLAYYQGIFEIISNTPTYQSTMADAYSYLWHKLQ